MLQIIPTKQFKKDLKRIAKDSTKDLNKLNSYAKKMRVSNVLRMYLEVLL